MLSTGSPSPVPADGSLPSSTPTSFIEGSLCPSEPEPGSTSVSATTRCISLNTRTQVTNLSHIFLTCFTEPLTYERLPVAWCVYQTQCLSHIRTLAADLYSGITLKQSCYSAYHYHFDRNSDRCDSPADQGYNGVIMRKHGNCLLQPCRVIFIRSNNLAYDPRIYILVATCRYAVYTASPYS